jgi:hypothetical protein
VTFTAAGSLTSAENAVAGTSTTYALTTVTAGNFILASLSNNSQPASAVSSTRVTWTKLTADFTFTSTSPSLINNIWLGTVNSAGSDTVTVTFAASMAGNNSRFDAREFHSSVGSVFLDKTGTVGPTASANWATLTPAGPGELYWGWSEDSGSAVAGSTSGFVYEPDSHSNQAGYCLSVSSAYTPVWGDAGAIGGVMVLMTETAPGGRGPQALVVPQAAVMQAANW